MNQKGHKYNSDIFNPNVFYEKTSVESKDILENRVLKSMLNEIIQIIVNLLLELKIEDINNDKKIHKINKRKDSLRERIDKINSEKTVSKSLENSIQRDLKIITREKKEYISIKKDIEKYIHNLNRIKNSLRFYIKESWLFDIESSKECLVTSKLIKNKYYSEIYRIYMYLKEGRTEGQQNISFAYKKTSKLFEIYTFLLLKDIFENFGFEWTDGWLRNANKFLSFNSDLNRGDYIILEHLDYKVKITYDSIIKKSRELSSSKSPISQISSKQYQRNIRPDILIELYKDNQFLEAIVVEVKYRKMKYIHSDIENTKVDEQLESYRDFEYYDADIKGVRRMLPINKVIAVYPQQNGAKKMVNPTYQNIMFIPISIKDEDSYSGYEGFRDEILEVIKPYIKEEDFNNIYDLEALDIKI